MVAAWIAPCSVKASGSVRRPPQLDVAKCDFKLANSSGSELEEEIVWEALAVTTHLLVEPPCRNPIERGQFGIEEHSPPTQHQNRPRNVLNRGLANCHSWSLSTCPDNCSTE